MSYNQRSKSNFLGLNMPTYGDNVDVMKFNENSVILDKAIRAILKYTTQTGKSFLITDNASPDVVLINGNTSAVTATVNGISVTIPALENIKLPFNAEQNINILCAADITVNYYKINGAGGSGGGYIKPESGIPATDMEETVQNALEDAETAIQPAELNEHTSNTNIHVTEAEKASWNAKSNFSGSYNDLTNRPSEATESQAGFMSASDKSKLDNINTSNFATKDELNAKYAKPSSGIPASDMTTSVQSSLAKAETALQAHQSLADYYTSAQTDAAIAAATAEISQSSQFKGTVAATTNLPSSGNEVGDNYYVSGASKYYKWNGSSWGEVEGQSNSLETYNARTNSAGTQFENLKSRLDDSDARVKTIVDDFYQEETISFSDMTEIDGGYFRSDMTIGINEVGSSVYYAPVVAGATYTITRTGESARYMGVAYAKTTSVAGNTQTYGTRNNNDSITIKAAADAKSILVWCYDDDKASITLTESKSAIGDIQTTVADIGENYVNGKFTGEITAENKYISYTNGTVGDLSGTKYVTFNVSEVKSFAYLYTHAEDSRGLAFYNSGGTFISGVRTTTVAQTVSVPTNAVTCKATVSNSDDIIFKNMSIANIVESISDIKSDVTILKNTSAKAEIEAELEAGYVQYTNGAIYEFQDTKHVTFSVTGANKIYYSETRSTPDSRGVAFFAADGTFISGVQMISTAQSINVPANAVTCKATVYNVNHVSFDGFNVYKVAETVAEMQSKAESFDKYVLTRFDNITCVGDSLTYSQVYTSASDSRQAKVTYPQALQKITGTTTSALATAGYTATQIWSHYQNDFVSKTNQCAICYIGTNDGLTDTLETDAPSSADPSTWANTHTGNYAKIINKLQSVGSKVILIQLRSCSEAVATKAVSNDVIRQLGERFGCPVVAPIYNYETVYHKWPNGQGTNGVHLNDLGYTAFAAELVNRLSHLSETELMYLI